MLAMPERGTVGRKKPLEAADFGGAGAGNGRTRQARVRGWPLERPRRLCRPWSPADQSVGRSYWKELCQLVQAGPRWRRGWNVPWSRVWVGDGEPGGR